MDKIIIAKWDFLSFILTNSHVRVQMSQERYIAMMEVTHIVTIHDALCIAPTMHEEVQIWQVNGTCPYLQHLCLYIISIIIYLSIYILQFPFHFDYTVYIAYKGCWNAYSESLKINLVYCAAYSWLLNLERTVLHTCHRTIMHTASNWNWLYIEVRYNSVKHLSQ